MAERLELIYKSQDGKTQIRGTRWYPEERQPKAILQIIHGSKESVDKYDSFARYVADRGVIVVAHDQIGHGKTAETVKDLGCFKDAKDADVVLIRDIHRLFELTQEEYPTLPYFMYGFELGSLIVRKYLSMYGEALDGAILVGPTWKNDGAITLGIRTSEFTLKTKGDKHKSKKAEDALYISNGIDDDKFIYSIGYVCSIWKMLRYTQEERNIRRIPHNLPVLLIDGYENRKESLEETKKTFEKFVANGIEQVSIKLYDDIVYDILNDARKHIAYLDILEWIEGLL